MSEEEPLTSSSRRFDRTALDKLTDTRDEAVAEMRDTIDASRGVYRVRHDWAPDRDTFADSPAGEAAYYAACYGACAGRVDALADTGADAFRRLDHREPTLDAPVFNPAWGDDGESVFESVIKTNRRITEMSDLYERYTDLLATDQIDRRRVRAELERNAPEYADLIGGGGQ